MNRPVFISKQCALLLLGAWLASPASAETLADPTRPPLMRGDEAEQAGPVLQYVRIAPAGRSEAIISGQTVRQGGKFGDAHVVKITETAVVLQNGEQLQTLRLFPDIEKRPVNVRQGDDFGSRGTGK